MPPYKKFTVNDLIAESKKDPNIITIEATVVTGFEGMAIEECIEKCNPSNVCKAQGRIFFSLLLQDFNKVLKLRAVDNVFLVNDAIGALELTYNKEEDLEVIKSLVNEINWTTLYKWAEIVQFNGILFPETKTNDTTNKVNHNIVMLEKNGASSCKEDNRAESNTVRNDERTHKSNFNHSISEHTILSTNLFIDKTQVQQTEVNKSKSFSINETVPRRLSISSDDTYYSAEEIELSKDFANKVKFQQSSQVFVKGVTNETMDSNVLKFRATCNRAGEHSFSSMDAAACFGGALNDKFNWTVNLTNFDLNVVLNINSNNCYICCAITERSLHRRNITHFGYTTLRPTLCYNMMYLAKPVKGDVIIDPLCGGGSIPIEGAIGFPYAYYICGDNNDKAMNRTFENLNSVNKSEPISVDPIRWDVKRLPLRESSVDICVTDLPFGKRSGRRSDNLPLYKAVLTEIARVCRCNTSRAVLLTHDKKSLTQAMSGVNSTYWRQIRTINVNQGGLFSTVFLLLRTAKPFMY